MNFHCYNVAVYWHFKGNILYFKAIKRKMSLYKYLKLNKIQYNKIKDTIAEAVEMRGNDTAVEGCKSYERLEVKLLPLRGTLRQSHKVCLQFTSC